MVGCHKALNATQSVTAFSSRRLVVVVVVLVVAADDGIMPQTIEAINHARAAEAPIVVAINKMDRPNADPNKVRNEMLQHELVTEELGGDILAVEVSAKEGTNLDKLSEAILLQSELLELKANPKRSAEGAVLEAKVDRGRGIVATLLVQKGTLNVGNIVVAGAQWGRVRAMMDDRGIKIIEAAPAAPVEVLGLMGVPEAGDEFVVVENERRAREVTEFRAERDRVARAARGAVPLSIEQMFAATGENVLEEMPLVVKADVHGSAEAIVGALNKFVDDKDVLICAAGSLPGDLHKLWRTKNSKGFHLEYGYSCMGYEIPGGLGAKMADPKREVYVMCGDATYLMLPSDLITTIQESYKIIMILINNNGYASIGGLSESVGGGGFGTEFKYRKKENDQIEGDYLPVDLAKNAESLGANVIPAKSLADFRLALEKAKLSDITTVVSINIESVFSAISFAISTTS